MKKIKKIIAGALAAALTLSVGSMFLACGSGETEYTFEAEEAEITDGIVTSYGQDGTPSTAPGKVTVESGTEYVADEDEEGAEVTNVGYFYGDGTKLTWKITAEKDCQVTIFVRAASAVDMMGAFMGGELFPDYEFADNKYFKLVVNDNDIALTGTVTGLEGVGFEQMSNPSVYKNFSLSDGVTVNLKQGENIVSLVSTNPSGGANVDCIKIKSSVKLTFTAADNSDRAASY